MSSSQHSIPSHMASTLHFALRIPYQNPKAADFLFNSITSSQFHPFYPLSSIHDDNTLSMAFKRVGLPPPVPIDKLPDGPDMRPDGIPIRDPQLIDGPMLFTYVATSDNIVLGYGLIDLELSDRPERSSARFCGIVRFVCDVRTSECVFTACYGTPRCIMIRATLDGPTGHRQVYKISVPDSEYVWPYLPNTPLCTISEILHDSSTPTHKFIPREKLDTLRTVDKSRSNSETTSFDGEDCNATTSATSTPLIPITPSSPIPCPLSPRAMLLSDEEQDFDLNHNLLVKKCFESSTSSLSPLPNSTLEHIHRSLSGKIFADTLRIDYSTGETIYTGASMTSFRMVSPEITTVQREKLWAMFLFATTSRAMLCTGRCVSCTLPCSPQSMGDQREVEKTELVKIAPKSKLERKQSNHSFSESADRDRLAAIRKENNRLSAARSYQRRRQRENSLENELSRWCDKKSKLVSREIAVREENMQLKWMLMEASRQQSQDQFVCKR